MKIYDTIAAVATPIGSGGVAIIRVSGEDAVRISQSIIKTRSGKALSELESHKLTLSYVCDPDAENDIIDQALVAVMFSPSSYTGEDVVEINCHGGYFAAQTILDRLLKAGARLAEPGEFTRRAFMNGKTDMLGAEAAIDIIDSHSNLGLQNAAKSLCGALSDRINALRERIIAITAHISAAADYPEEVDEPDTSELCGEIAGISSEIDKLLSGFNTGKILRDGITTVIVGKPNVGKSSILNALARADRAIVTDIPGTTRDIIEEYINIKGAALRLMDTAGIRAADDEVEQIGVELAKESIDKADLCLFVIDSAAALTDEDYQIADKLKNSTALAILNKTDKGGEATKDMIIRELGFPESAIVETATPKDEPPSGIEALEDKIADMFITGKADTGEVFISNERQKDSLLKAKNSISLALDAAENGAPFDLLYIDLEDSLSALGEVIGLTVQEEIIDQVFSRFCVGK